MSKSNGFLKNFFVNLLTELPYWSFNFRGYHSYLRTRDLLVYPGRRKSIQYGKGVNVTCPFVVLMTEVEDQLRKKIVTHRKPTLKTTDTTVKKINSVRILYGQEVILSRNLTPKWKSSSIINTVTIQKILLTTEQLIGGTLRGEGRESCIPYRETNEGVQEFRWSIFDYRMERWSFLDTRPCIMYN